MHHQLYFWECSCDTFCFGVREDRSASQDSLFLSTRSTTHAMKLLVCYKEKTTRYTGVLVSKHRHLGRGSWKGTFLQSPGQNWPGRSCPLWPIYGQADPFLVRLTQTIWIWTISTTANGMVDMQLEKYIKIRRSVTVIVTFEKKISTFLELIRNNASQQRSS